MRVLAACLSLLVLATVLTIAGSASACSFVREPDPPGAFYVYDPVSHAKWRIPVADRSLGAGCELSNPHDFDGETLVYAWSDGGTSTLHIHDVATGDATSRLVRGGPIHRVGVDGDILLYVTKPDTDDGHGVEVRRIDMATGDDTAVGIRGPRGTTVTLWRSLVVVTDFAGAAVTSAYDAKGDRWWFEDKTLAQLGVPSGAHLAAAGPAWLLFVADDSVHAHELSTGRATRLAGVMQGAWTIGVDGDHVWGRLPDGQLERVRLPVGPAKTYDAPPGEFLGRAGGGHLVLGAYSSPKDDGSEAPYVPGDRPSSVPALGVVAPLALVAVAQLTRSVRGRTGR